MSEEPVEVVEEVELEASVPEAEEALRGDEIEEVDGLPVVADVRPIEAASSASLPAVQAAAVAATSFVAGAATVAVVRRHRTRKLARQRARSPFEGLPIVGSRRFLVDVHLIGRGEE